jgi:hypothetical protein
MVNGAIVAASPLVNGTRFRGLSFARERMRSGEFFQPDKS